MARALLASLTQAVTVAGVLWFGSTPASAHTRLLSSTPSAGAIAPTPVSVLRLRFSEALIGRFSCLTLVRRDGTKASGVTCSVATDGKTLIATLRTPLAAGAYNLAWHAVATDTHRSQGAFTFMVR
jgi:methionine-rich copper-binding protein CopC